MPVMRYREALNQALREEMQEDENVLSEKDLEKLDEEAMATVDEAVKFADKSPFPELDSLYDDVYVYGEQVKGWYTVDERSPDLHPGEEERDAPQISHDLAKAGAAYAGTGEQRPEEIEDEGVISDEDYEKLDEAAVKKVDAAVEFADNSPFPELDSLYDDIYVLEGDRAPAWWTVDERSPEPHRGEDERDAGKVPHELAEKGAAYANVGDRKARQGGTPKDQDDEGGGEGEQSGEEPEEEGGAD